MRARVQGEINEVGRCPSRFAGAWGLLSALALAMPIAAAAQDNRYTLPPGQARVLVVRYAACMVRARSAQIRTELLAWTPGASEPRLLMLNDCSPPVAYDTTELTFAPATYRYAMAEALYVADYGTHPIASYDAVPLSPLPTLRSPDEATPAATAGYDYAVAERYRLIVGDCVVRTGPGATHALLVSQVETPAEAAALAGVQPIMAQCLPAGQTAHFSRSSLRGVLAIAALRLNAAAGAVPQTSGGTH